MKNFGVSSFYVVIASSIYYWNFTITPDLIELRNLASVAEMIIDCAIARQESRGLHYNIDCEKYSENSRIEDTVILKPEKPYVRFEDI